MNPVSGITPNAATGDQSSAAAFSAPSVPSDTSSNGPSVTVDLSENAKAALAAANENQNAANRILAFVDANRSGDSRRGHASRNWSDGEPSLEQEYQQLAWNLSQNPNGHQPSQGDVLTITLSEYSNASLSVESGSGAGAISASVPNTIPYPSRSMSTAVRFKLSNQINRRPKQRRRSDPGRQSR
jgi:flagellar basal body L-ring protein FlgH